MKGIKISLKMYVSILESFEYKIRILDTYKGTTYVCDEKDRYTNICIDGDRINVHTNYKTYGTKPIYDIDFYCDTTEKLEKYLHKLHPQKSRSIKLKRILGNV